MSSEENEGAKQHPAGGGHDTTSPSAAPSEASNSLWDSRQAFRREPEQPGTAAPLESTSCLQPAPWAALFTVPLLPDTWHL